MTDIPPESSPVLSTPLGRLRLVGLIEGCSTLVLFFGAMPYRFFTGDHSPVRVVGTAHGFLFVAYCAAIVLAWFDRKWGWKRPLLLGAAAVLPFGPFLLEPSLRREQATAEKNPASRAA